MRAATARPGHSLRTVGLVDLYLTDGCARGVRKDTTRRSREARARSFAEAFPDLDAWMRLPTDERKADVHRLGARHFIEWCFVDGHLRPDLEFLLRFRAASLYSSWGKRHPDQVAKVSEVGERIGWRRTWVKLVARDQLGLMCMWAGKPIEEFSDPDFSAFGAALDEVRSIKDFVHARTRARAFCIHQVCYQLGLCQSPPREWHRGPLPLDEHLTAIPQPEIRKVIRRYIDAVSTTLAPGTLPNKHQSLILFAEYLAAHHPKVRRLAELDRERHVEGFLVWNAQRTYRGRKSHLGRQVSRVTAHRTVADLRMFFADLGLWGWAERPRRQLFFTTDNAKKPELLPRALAPDVDRDLMREVHGLEDPFARSALLILRGTGIRIGELLDLELDCLWDTPSHGTWLKVPLGKLKTERMVPLDAETLRAIHDWMKVRDRQRAVPHPRQGRPAEFMFMEHGRRLAPYRVHKGLRVAGGKAGLKGPGGEPLKVTPHQLRHTYATSLINAGMSLEALMALLGHVTPEMTLRYARLASPTIRTAYDTAMEKVKARSQMVPLAGPVGPGSPPDRLEWLRSEMLKTRVAHGYCSRHLAADACPYANICEQCDNYVTAPEFVPALESQLADVRALREDAAARGWDTEVARHARVIARIETHLQRLGDQGDTQGASS